MAATGLPQQPIQPNAGTDWWTQNAPVATGAGFTPDPGHGTPVAPGSPPFVSGQPPPAQYTTGGASGGGPPTGGSLSDPAYAAQLVAYYANQPGADPSLKNDPNYWIQKMTSGEFGSDQGYAVSKMQTAWQGGGSSNPYGALAGGGNSGNATADALGVNPAVLGIPSAPYASDPNAPTPYAAPTFTAPTAAEVQGQPGYQIGLDTGLQQINRSAAAKGTVLNPGTVQALNQYGTNYAGTQYGNVLAQDLGVFNTNTGNAQTAYQNQYGNYLANNARTFQDYMANYGINHTASTDYFGYLNGTANRGASSGAALPVG